MILNFRGDVAQLGERYVRNVQVDGSIPFISTRNNKAFSLLDSGIATGTRLLAIESVKSLFVIWCRSFCVSIFCYLVKVLSRFDYWSRLPFSFRSPLNRSIAF